MTYLLDACALIAFLNEEKGKGCETVSALLEQAEAGEITLYMSRINFTEVYYNIIRKYGTVEAADVIMLTVAALPITLIGTISHAVCRDAARMKISYSMSFADTFLCATAKSINAVIVTKDGEIAEAEKAEPLSVLWIT